jgi:hypothetical protein
MGPVAIGWPPGLPAAAEGYFLVRIDHELKRLFPCAGMGTVTERFALALPAAAPVIGPFFQPHRVWRVLRHAGDLHEPQYKYSSEMILILAMLDECAVPVLLEGRLQLLICVHHDRSVPGYRFSDGLA